MTRALSQLTGFLAIFGLVVGVLGASPASADDEEEGGGHVYTLTNATSGNSVLAFDRAENGTLKPTASVATGGNGSGAGLGSQGAIIMSDNGKWLFAVNAGTNDISTFAVTDKGLTLKGRVQSGGTVPISLTTDGRVIYALNSGTPANVTGFAVRHDGHLAAIPGSTQRLSGTAPAEVALSRSGVLVVTDKGSSTIETFVLDKNGAAGPSISHTSHGQTPFGFAFGKRDQVFVSEAANSAASSYIVGREGSLTLVSGSVRTTGQSAACWLVVTRNGRFAYTTNTGSDSISSFAIDKEDGSIKLLEAVAGGGPTHPTDVALNDNSKFLYVLGTGSIRAYKIGKHGALTPIAGAPSVPAGAVGLAAR